MRRPMVAPGPARLRGVGHFAAPTLAISRARVSRLKRVRPRVLERGQERPFRPFCVERRGLARKHDGGMARRLDPGSRRMIAVNSANFSHVRECPASSCAFSSRAARSRRRRATASAAAIRKCRRLFRKRGARSNQHSSGQADTPFGEAGQTPFSSENSPSVRWTWTGSYS